MTSFDVNLFWELKVEITLLDVIKRKIDITRITSFYWNYKTLH